MLANLVVSLITHRRVKTTLAKAKAVRPAGGEARHARQGRHAPRPAPRRGQARPARCRPRSSSRRSLPASRIAAAATPGSSSSGRASRTPRRSPSSSGRLRCRNRGEDRQRNGKSGSRAQGREESQGPQGEGRKEVRLGQEVILSRARRTTKGDPARGRSFAFSPAIRIPPKSPLPWVADARRASVSCSPSAARRAAATH